jgi:hypothetical protein
MHTLDKLVLLGYFALVIDQLANRRFFRLRLGAGGTA